MDLHRDSCFAGTEVGSVVGEPSRSVEGSTERIGERALTCAVVADGDGVGVNVNGHVEHVHGSVVVRRIDQEFVKDLVEARHVGEAEAGCAPGRSSGGRPLRTPAVGRSSGGCCRQPDHLALFLSQFQFLFLFLRFEYQPGRDAA